MIDVLRLSIPLMFWLVSFSAVYGLHGIVCAMGWAGLAGLGEMSLGRLILLAGWAGAIRLQAGCLVVLATERFGSPVGFIRRISLALSLTAFIAAIWTLFPISVLPPCK